MSKPAFIVDGFTEKLILERICPGSRVSRTDLNGNCVTIQAIGKKISTLIKVLGNRYYPIIVIVDKEDRDKSCEELITELSTEINNNGCANQDIRVFFADRMVENWIIADWNILGTTKEKPENTDGLRGSKVIKENKGKYSKTIDGVELFMKCDTKAIYNNSPSFKKLIDEIQDIDCYFKDINCNE